MLSSSLLFNYQIIIVNAFEILYRLEIMLIYISSANFTLHTDSVILSYV